MSEPENLVLALLREIRGDVADIRSTTTTKTELAGLRSDVQSLRADVASDLAALEEQLSDQEKRLSEQIAGLRRAVMEYHSTAIGHGVLFTEIEERVRRIEQHLNLPTH
jgi:hypothetical protein